MATRARRRAGRVERTGEGSQELSRTAEEWRLLAGQLARLLADRYGARRVYLFGSLASGTHFHEHSDIDLAAEGLPSHRYFEALAELWDFLPPGVELDLIPMEFASPEMRRVVETEGVLLHATR